MKRTRVMSFMTGSLMAGVLPVLLAPAAHAQAPSRPAAGSYYDVKPPTSSRAGLRSDRPSATADRGAASRASTAVGGSSGPDPRPADSRARDYYVVPSIRYVPPARRARGADYLRAVPSRPRPRDEDTYSYKS